MAETANPTQTPAAPQAAPPAAPAETATTPIQAPHRENKFLAYLSKFLTTTTWLVFGVILVILGIVEHQFRISHAIPGIFQGLLTRFIPHLPYFLAGLGFICIGHVRSLHRQDYSAKYKKNRQFLHAWKIPLISAQVFILQGVIGLYPVLVGVGVFQPIKNLMGLTFFFILFLGYVLWYAIADIKNHFPSAAGFIIAMVGLSLAGISFLIWSGPGWVFLSLVFGLLAVVSSITSLSISNNPDQRESWVKYLSLAATMGLLFHVGLNASQFGNPHVDLLGLNLASKDPNGVMGNLTYAPDNNRIAFSLKTKEGWYLQIIDGKHENKTFKISAGEDTFRPFFIDGGKSLMLDGVKGGARGLWKVNTANGSVVILKTQGVQPFGDGVPWSEKSGKFLYVQKSGSQYQLRAYPQPKGNTKPLLSSANPILSPSWTATGEDVAYADGAQGLFQVLNVKTGKSVSLLSQQEKAENQNWAEFPISEVIPAPDNFRYLYLTQKDKLTSLWTVLSDGSKRKMIYKANGTLRNISWFPDGQKIIFEEKKRRFGFIFATENIRLLDANLETVEDLILPQISHRSPAVSSEGVKVAFVGDQGLWYRTGNAGIWEAILR